jgi:hypothetical protein
VTRRTTVCYLANTVFGGRRRRTTADCATAFSTGRNYVNFQLAEDAADRTAAAYGSNLE